MGWTVLYIAFGFVALWLLGEVLLQYKARLRWRLVAFCGFLGVVLGVLMPSVPVIALGAVAFATGQTFVTLSFRRGFSTGWALGGKPGTSKRRRERAGGAIQPMPAVPDVPAAPSPPEAPYEAAPDAFGAPAMPQPPAEAPSEAFADYAADGGGYGGRIYTEEFDGQGQQALAGYGEAPADAYDAGRDTYHDPYAPVGQGLGGYPGEYPSETPAWGTPQADYAAETYQPEHQPYAATYAAADYPGHAVPAGDQGAAGYPPLSDPYYQETPAGGLWVPQQRESHVPDPGYGYPQQQPDHEYPRNDGYDSSGQGYYFTDDQRY
ncbi:hypothetical protein [Streptomyces sp. SBT349]|uniref:hypothetical protein n=1 Tax=Streptomyces sp. SBT349 TaxID=1580539 RepID=UPI00069F8A1E|nr:hypothetical protein [Streptomyces sp. SBT349]